MSPSDPVRVSQPRAARNLILIALGSALVLILGLSFLLNYTLRRIDLLVRIQAQDDAFRGAAFINARLAYALRSQWPDLALDDAGGDWLEPLLQELVAEDSRLAYVMVISPTGAVLAHSDPAQVGLQLPLRVLDRIVPPVLTGRWEADVESWTGHGQVLDASIPVTAQGLELGAIHVGISQDRLDKQVARAQAIVPIVLALTCLLCLAILVGSVAVSGLALGRVRRATAAGARAHHRAEVSALAAGLVHEVRNPLNAMRMHLALLRRQLASGNTPGTPGTPAPVSPRSEARNEKSETPSSPTLERLEAEVSRLQKLADDFLDFGRPTQPQAPPSDFRAVLRQTAEFLAPEFEQAGLALLLELPEQDQPVPVAVGPGRLRQVVLNLAANARAAMTPGGRLTFSLSRHRRQAILRVSDTGSGINAQALPHIFDVFYTNRPGGTGLGLTIVRQIVEDAGGQVHVTSEVGQGTTFEVTLPLAR